jgi:hypothetical protein
MNVFQCPTTAFAAMAVCLALCEPAASASTSEPTGAEFAIRWNAREGGPKTGDEVLAILNMRAKGTQGFKVNYYDFPSKAKAPPGFSTILRRRVDDAGVTNLTWKLRGDRALAEWACPLENSRRAKAEVDVTFRGADIVDRMYSYSCTSASPERAASLLAAIPMACTAAVTRWETGQLKVEEWRLARDVLIIEVSGNGANTSEGIERFGRRVVAPLLAAGIVPSAQSKTELGSHCE